MYVLDISRKKSSVMYLQKAIQKRKTTTDFLKQVYNLSVF